MADPAKLPKEELKRICDLGAATYLSAYVRLMAREIGVDDSDTNGINHMVLQITGPMNHAAEAMWRALMDDHEGMEQALGRFTDSLYNL